MINAAKAAGAMSLVSAKYAQFALVSYELIMALGELYAALWIPSGVQYKDEH